MPSFSIVGLPDKAVSEARERVRAALNAMAIALPARKVTINMSPADLPKEGSHFDLPIALAVLAALEIIPSEEVENTLALGELSLDGSLVPVIGALPAAMAAAEDDRALICPKACGAEAAWVGAAKVLAARTLPAVIQHFTGQSPLDPADPGEVSTDPTGRDLLDVKGQERAQARVGDRRRRASPPDDGRQPRRGQVHAGRTPAVDPAASIPVGGVGNLHDSIACGAPGRWRHLPYPALP